MKTIIISAVAAMLSIGANANTLSANASKIGASAVSSKLATYSELSRENSLLKLKVAELAEEAEELQSQVSYERLMHATIGNLNALRTQEEKSELEAKIAYQQTMTHVLLNLQSKK